MTKKVRAWWRALLASMISAAATGASSFTGASVVMPEAGVLNALKISAAAAATAAFGAFVSYLKKSPLPPTDKDIAEMRQSIVASIPRPRVLLVDDSEDFAQIVAVKVKECDFVFSFTCADAKSKCASFQFDAIVIDRVLPDCDGLTLVPDIHAMQPKARLIVVTGYHMDPKMIQAACAGGAVAFLSKTTRFFEELKHFLNCASQALTNGMAATTVTPSGDSPQI